MKHIMIRDEDIVGRFLDKKYELRKRDKKIYTDEEVVGVLLSEGKNGKKQH